MKIFNTTNNIRIVDNYSLNICTTLMSSSFSGADDPDEQSDVTVIVGETEFKHSSHMLRYSSPFFDDLFKRNETVASFPDKNSWDWSVVAKFLEPGVAQPSIDVDNVHRLLPWFEILRMTSFLEVCDEVYPTELAPEEGSLYLYNASNIESLMLALKMGFKFNLPKTKKFSMRLLIQYIGHEAAMYAVYAMSTRCLGRERGVWAVFSRACCKRFLGSATNFEELLQQQGRERNGYQPKPKCKACGLLHHTQKSYSHVHHLASRVYTGWQECFVAYKRTTIPTPEGRQPKDVTIIVGNKEFQHSSRMLRHSSQFFDAMFSHNLREHNEMVVRFPDKDPSDWDLVRQFLEPGVFNQR